MVSFKVVIPARYGSTRLPGKALRMIAGKPMIVHVCERARSAGAEEVVVATDDDRIVTAVEALGMRAVMTRSDHRSGTERIAETARLCGWSGEQIIVNVQGDEPLIEPGLIESVARALAADDAAAVATVAAPIDQADNLFDPNVVKVVRDRRGYALYFSRAPIPWDRDRFGSEREAAVIDNHWRHIGLYAYTVEFIQRYVAWPVSVLEQVECLEQLRILWQGEKIFVHTVATCPAPGVDTAEDLQRVEQLFQTPSMARPAAQDGNPMTESE